MDMINITDKEVSLEGKVLIASPHLEDPYFSRSIIYICAHDETGTVGVIVNHRLGMLTCRDLLIFQDKKKDLLEGKKFPLLFGGPVNTDMLIALSLKDKNSIKELQEEEDITIHMDIGKFFKDKVKKKIVTKKFLLVKGVTAWDSHQLEEEIADNCWFVLPATPDIVFSPRGKDKWPDLMKKLGIRKFHELVSYSGTS